MIKSILLTVLISIGYVAYTVHSKPQILDVMMRYFVDDLPFLIAAIAVILCGIRWGRRYL